MAENEAVGKKETREKQLLGQACKAYAIEPEFVFSSRVDGETGEIIIVTNGGSKVRWAEGMKVAPLTSIQVTGINPIKRKPITGPDAGKKK